MYLYIGGGSPTIPTRKLGSVIERLHAREFGLGTNFIEFKHVMEPFPTPIMILTPDKKIVYVNLAWEQLTGYSLEETQGRDPSFLSSGKTNQQLFKTMWKTLSRGQPFESESIIDKRKDGSEFHIHSVIFPVRSQQKTFFYVQVEQDITNRKKLEDLKKEFLSMATHELKTPITTLKLLIQLQMRRLLKQEFTKVSLHELEVINRELGRLIRIVDDITDVSRVEAGKLRMEIREVNIVYIIKDVIRQMRRIAKDNKIKAGLLLPVYVLADEDRIKQVLINLIKNASKFAYPKSDIVISATVRNRRCVISVRNMGEGIPKQNMDLIFDRFYQLHSGDTSGLGLGLYIAKKIVEQHKGKIWVESEKGALTTFYFSLIIAEKGNG